MPPRIIPENPTLEAYGRVFQRDILRFFFNSYFVGFTTTAVSLFVAAFASYSFSRFVFKGKLAANIFVVATQIVPPIAILVPFYILIIRVQLYDTYLGLIVTYTSFCLPYCIIMLTGYFNTISTELDDAVKIDGGSRLTTLWRVIMPVSVPGIIATGVFSFLLTWNDFLWASSLVQSDNRRTVPVGIALLAGQHITDWVGQMTMAFVASVPVLILYLLVQRYFVSGLSAGAVKG